MIVIARLWLFMMLIIASTCHGTELSSQESTILNKFFREMLDHSEGGYVLFDAKPVCIHGFHAEDDFIGEYPQHLSSVILREGSVTLKNLKFKEKNIIIHTYNNKDSLAEHYVHILFINKKLFLEAVQKNLPLFQYVLGPEVTPEKLLNKITDPEQTFHDVLKNDKVLIGILLGFGTQNSLYGARVENIETLRFSESPPFERCITKFSHVPIEFKKHVFLNCSQYGNRERGVCFGYSSIDEELKTMKQKMDVSSEKLETLSPIFIFGHLHDDESKALVAKLEYTQEKIRQLLSLENFLETTLHLIFHEERINLPVSEKMQLSFDYKDQKRLPFLIAGNIWKNMADDCNPYLESFIKGMTLAEENIKFSDFPINYGDWYLQNKFLKIQKNLVAFDKYFDLLSQDKSMTQAFNLPLYYRKIKNGTDNHVKNFTEVVIRYSMSYPDGEMIVDTFKSAKPERLDMNALIPGFALGIVGMQKDEERELLIHPSLAYGILTALQKGVYLKARVQLLDFVENDSQEFVDFFTFKPLDLNLELINLGMISEKELADMDKSVGLIDGYRIWQHYKKTPFYTLPQILEWINLFKTTNDEPAISSLNDQNLINRLHWNLYHQKV